MDEGVHSPATGEAAGRIEPPQNTAQSVPTGSGASSRKNSNAGDDDDDSPTIPEFFNSQGIPDTPYFQFPDSEAANNKMPPSVRLKAYVTLILAFCVGIFFLSTILTVAGVLLLFLFGSMLLGLLMSICSKDGGGHITVTTASAVSMPGVEAPKIQVQTYEP